MAESKSSSSVKKNSSFSGKTLSSDNRKLPELKGRFLVWVLLIPLTLAVMAVGDKWWWVAAVYALLWVVVASVEFLRLYLKPFRWYHLFFLISPLVIWFYALFLTPFSFASHLFIALAVQIFLWLLFSASKPRLIFPLLILPLYLGFIPSHFLLIKQVALRHDLSYAWLVFPFAVTWINDTAAYLLGSLLGRTKLCPKVSPKKTVEGFLLGLAVTVAAGISFSLLFLKTQPWWLAAITALAVGGAGVVGDLLESAIKRERGVKNSSNILGGHGGFLDRIDSLIFGVAIYYYMYFFLQHL